MPGRRKKGVTDPLGDHDNYARVLSRDFREHPTSGGKESREMSEDVFFPHSDVPGCLNSPSNQPGEKKMGHGAALGERLGKGGCQKEIRERLQKEVLHGMDREEKSVRRRRGGRRKVSLCMFFRNNGKVPRRSWRHRIPGKDSFNDAIGERKKVGKGDRGGQTSATT